jgi:hypothetical protein
MKETSMLHAPADFFPEKNFLHHRNERLIGTLWRREEKRGEERRGEERRGEERRGDEMR